MINFTVDPVKSKDALKKLTWQEQCLATELLCKYLPSHIREMMPVDEGYTLTWVSIESYNSFINEPLYKQINDILDIYGITINFTSL